MGSKSPRSVALASFAEALFGPSWAASVARLTGHHVRGVQRIRDAANQGREHARAEAVANALSEAVQALLADAEALATVRVNRRRHKRAKASPGRVLQGGEREAAITRLDRAVKPRKPRAPRQ